MRWCEGLRRKWKRRWPRRFKTSTGISSGFPDLLRCAVWVPAGGAAQAGSARVNSFFLLLFIPFLVRGVAVVALFCFLLDFVFCSSLSFLLNLRSFSSYPLLYCYCPLILLICFSLLVHYVDVTFFVFPFSSSSFILLFFYTFLSHILLHFLDFFFSAMPFFSFFLSPFYLIFVFICSLASFPSSSSFSSSPSFFSSS